MSSLNQKICSVEGCDSIFFSKKLCRKHHQRWWRDTHYAYSTWQGMRQRCNNKKTNNYQHYGGRGIKVCERWDSFANFLADMGERPSPRHTLDRIDNDGDYEPDNCKWSTRVEQISNRRMGRNNKSGVTGVSWHRVTNKWTAQACLNYEKIYLGVFATKQEAIAARKQWETSNHI